MRMVSIEREFAIGLFSTESTPLPKQKGHSNKRGRDEREVRRGTALVPWATKEKVPMGSTRAKASTIRHLRARVRVRVRERGRGRGVRERVRLRLRLR